MLVGSLLCFGVGFGARAPSYFSPLLWCQLPSSRGFPPSPGRWGGGSFVLMILGRWTWGLDSTSKEIRMGPADRFVPTEGQCLCIIQWRRSHKSWPDIRDCQGCPRPRWVPGVLGFFLPLLWFWIVNFFGCFFILQMVWGGGKSYCLFHRFPKE